MKLNRNRVLTGAAIAVCLIAAAAISQPGRAALGGLYAKLRATSITAAPAPPPLDLEGRAREKHGWDRTPESWVMRGTIAYFDPSSAMTRRNALTIYRKDKEQIRVDVEHQGVIQAQGLYNGEEWQARAGNLSESQERDIRAWLRIFPDRLFVERAKGKAYRELGRLIDSRPDFPGRGPKDPRAIKQVEQVEVEDVIDRRRGDEVRKSDKRLITYLIARDDSLVISASWHEPDDPTQSEGEVTASREVRVDFGGWRRVGGVLWPLEITRWQGGKLDFHIELQEVQVNRGLPDTVFQKPQ